MVNKVTGFFARTQRFLTEDIWELDIYTIGGLKRQVVRLLRITQLVIRGYREDRLSLHASSLTYTTLMSLVPFLAFVFALVKGLGDQQAFLLKVDEWMASLPETLQSTISDNVITPVLSINPAALGAFGSGIFLFAIIKVLGSIEGSFNTVWGVTESRTLLRKFTDYISTVVIVPVAVLTGSALQKLVPKPVEEVAVEGEVVLDGAQQVLNTGPDGLLNFSSLFLICLAFWFLYRFLPNTQVKAMPALVAGIVIGVMARAWHLIGLKVIAELVDKNPVYATFASVPLFLLVLYITWVLVLLGAELSFAIQNSTTYVMEQKAITASPISRVRLGLAIVIRTAESMLQETPRFNVQQYVKKYHVPLRLVSEICHILKSGGYLAEDAETQGSYVLARDAGNIPVKDIVDAVLNHGSQSRELGLSRLDVTIEDALEALSLGMDQKLGDLTIKEIVQR